MSLVSASQTGCFSSLESPENETATDGLRGLRSVASDWRCAMGKNAAHREKQDAKRAIKDK